MFPLPYFDSCDLSVFTSVVGECLSFSELCVILVANSLSVLGGERFPAPSEHCFANFFLSALCNCLEQVLTSMSEECLLICLSEFCLISVGDSLTVLGVDGPSTSSGHSSDSIFAVGPL